MTPATTEPSIESTGRGSVQRGLATPGLHSYNLRRRSNRPRRPVLRALRVLFMLAGLAGIGYYGYSLADQYIYQAYANWAFDQGISGHRVTFEDYLRSETPLRYFLSTAPPTPTIAKAPSIAVEPGLPSPPRPAEGDLLGKLEIARLNISAMVREGVDDDTLRRAVGHVPSTALPGETGNFSIAAHRDTLFRALKDIKKDDRITFQSENHTFVYQVVSTQIVKPTDVSVLNAEADQKLLTMITCYPFYFVGSAPERFIVKARMLEEKPETGAAPLPAPATVPADKPPPPKPVAQTRPHSPPMASAHAPRQPRGFSHSASNTQITSASNRHTATPRHPGIWRRIVSVFTRHTD
jgi:sortase A